MVKIPVLRWGQPYESLEFDNVIHFVTGETLAKVSQANPGLLAKDMKKAQRAREVLREIPIRQLVQIMKKAADLYKDATLPMGDGQQSPDDFARQQSASTGLPEHMCKAQHGQEPFRALEHGPDSRLPHARAAAGHSHARLRRRRSRRRRQLPGAIAGARAGAAIEFAGRAHALDAGDSDADRPGAQARPAGTVDAVSHGGGVFRGRRAARSDQHLSRRRARWARKSSTACQRVKIFGSTETVKRYHGNPCVQVHGPGFSKILLGDDVVDNWEKYIDLMVDSVYLNSGRGCINCSGVWASRHTKEIAQALARAARPHRREAAGRSQPPRWPRSPCRARRKPFTRPSSTKMKEDGVDRHDSEVRAASGREGTLRLPAAVGHSLRFAGAQDRADRIHVPLRHGRAMSAEPR